MAESQTNRRQIELCFNNELWAKQKHEIKQK